MGAVLPQIAALLTGILCLGFANGGLFALIGLRMTLDGYSPRAVGLVGAAYACGYITGTLLGSRIVGRGGHARAFALFMAVASVGVLGLSLFSGLLPWMLARAVSGFGVAGMFLVCEAWLNAKATNETRARVFAVYIAVHGAAFSLSPFLVTLADPTSHAPFTIAAMLMVLGILPMALTRVPDPPRGARRGFDLRTLVRASPLGIAAVVATGLYNGAYFNLGTVYGKALGLPTMMISTAFSAVVFGGFLAQYPAGALADRMDRRHMLLALSTGTMVIGLAIAATGATAAPLMIALCALFGATTQTVYGIGAAHLNDRVDPADFLPNAAGLLFAFSVGSAIGPLTASQAMIWFGPPGLFLHAATIGGLVALLACYRMVRARRVERR